MSHLSFIESVTVGIPVKDIQEAVTWYERIFGTVTGFEPVPGIREIEINPGFWLQLLEVDEINPGQGIVRFGVFGIEAERERLLRLNIEVGPVHRINGVVAYCNFCDPYGNRLGLYETLEK
ncbi:MAG TPA: VOC family protein [Bacilli bacterium]